MSTKDVLQGQSLNKRSKGAENLSSVSLDSNQQPRATRGKQKPPKNQNRRSHTKSRQGCFTCKLRKIKCDEGHPSCSHCLYRGNTCIYPPRNADARAGASAGRLPPNPGRTFVPFRPEVELLAPPSQKLGFTAQELRFFHYFLTSMKHPLPLGNRSVWIQEIPQISHEYPFLMHAILALGASEMERANLHLAAPSNVLKHRGRAIAGLNRALDDSNSWSTYGHPDAVLATCYALIYQSSRISDAMKDFSVLVQGCALITNKIQQSRLKTVMNVSPDWPRHQIEPALQVIQANLHEHHMVLVKTGLECLQEIQETTTLSEELLFFKACFVTLEQFYMSPVEGYTFSITRYSAWYRLAGGMLEALRDPDNWTVLVLVASFMANMILLKVLIPIHAWPDGKDRLPFCTLRRMMLWIEAIDEHVEKSRRRHITWARDIVSLVPMAAPQVHYNDSRVDQGASRIDLLHELPSSAHMVLGEVLRLGSEVTAWFEEFVSDMYQTSQKVIQPTGGIHAIPAPSMLVPPSNLPSAYGSPPAMQNLLQPLEFPNAAQLLTTNTMDHGGDEAYGNPPPGLSAMDSDTFPFEIFSELDAVRNVGQRTTYHLDNINDDNEIFDIFHD
ncbi:hypothetical protein LTR84_002935 [Exophiala bonariae]|uniref:Zn(2)-C6 fungal-type domain-containing protein n=1 Tax=Exophiala bonariae TaxID=1690606 RepID=A0AAV9N900_9EURO|nr:hypothetical protein LTR84_002935 [Exophiala bonariae]